MSAEHEPVIPEPIREDYPGYAPGHWDYPRRCADVESALTAARERIAEWDREADPHGWWHERPAWIALHNEVIRLRHLVREEQATLEAFREVTGWSDEDVLHYASCDRCTPVCGAEEENCPQSPASIALAAHIAARRAAGNRGEA